MVQRKRYGDWGDDMEGGGRGRGDHRKWGDGGDQTEEEMQEEED